MNDIKTIDKTLFIVGICSLVNAYGIRFIWDDLNDVQKQKLLDFGITKIAIFTLLFVTTKSLVVSSILLVLYLYFMKYIKKENDKYHIIFNLE